MRTKKVTGEIRKLFTNKGLVQGCFPTEMVKYAGLEKGGHVVVLQKRDKVDMDLQDGDIVVRRLPVQF